MKTQPYEFRPQLVKGKQGQKLFAHFYKEYNPVEAPEKALFDFTLSHPHPLSKNTKVEVKTDFFASGNMFLERYVVIRGQYYDGGPWRAMQEDADFIYILKEYKTIHWFNSKALCDFVEKSGIKPIQGAPNKDGRYSIGYKVPFELLEVAGVLLEKAEPDGDLMIKRRYECLGNSIG